MQQFGVEVNRGPAGNQTYTIYSNRRYASPGEIFVEGDASSASYFLAAGAIGGGPVRVLGMGTDSIQGDKKFAVALKEMGAIIDASDNWTEASAPLDKLKGINLDCNHIPDAAMTLAILALFARAQQHLEISPVGASKKLTASPLWQPSYAKLALLLKKVRITSPSHRQRN